MSLLTREFVKRPVYTRRIKVRAFIKCSFFKQTAFNPPFAFVISKAILNTLFYRDFQSSEPSQAAS